MMSSRYLRLLIGSVFRVAFVVACGVLATSVALAAPSAAATMTIGGTVVDGTAGSKLPPDLKVTLDGVDATGQALAERSASVDPSGKFTFDGVPSGGKGYIVSADYAGVRYRATVDVKGGSPSPVTVKVYEPTTSDQSLRLASAYWVVAAVDAKDQQITVLENLTVQNAGDRTFIGDHRGDPGSDAPGVLPRTIRLPLPQGASDFTVAAGLDPNAVLPVANGFVDTDPVTPGQHQIVYHYVMAFADGGFEIRKSLPYPADNLIFLAPDSGYNIRSDRLGDGGTTTIGGTKYVVMGANKVPANQDVIVDVLGLPNPPTSRVSPDTLRLVAVAVSVPFLLAALALGIRASQRFRRDIPAERHALLSAIAQLDDRFERGQVDPTRYAAEREKHKQQLALLMLQEPEPSGAGRAAVSR